MINQGENNILETPNVLPFREPILDYHPSTAGNTEPLTNYIMTINERRNNRAQNRRSVVSRLDY